MRFSLALILPLSLFAFKELPQIGKTYDVSEESFIAVLKRDYDALDKEELKRNILKQVEAKLQANLSLPFCSADKTREVKIERKLPFELPDFGITNESMLKQQNIHIPKTLFYIVNAEEKTELEWLKKTIKDPSNAYIIITKGNIKDKRLQQYKNKYIADKEFLAKYPLVCTPTILDISSNGTFLKELKIRRFQ